ncbi:MAG: hypothetical protein ABFS34_16540, partial [Gemmatimonadota bacterium]
AAEPAAGATREPRRGRGARREEAKPAAPAGAEDDRYAAAFALLVRAVVELADGKGPVRDSELKRRMLQLDDSWDEATLGFSKFSRFLRKAHDEEVIDLHRTPDGYYETSLGRNAPAGAGSAPSRPTREVAAEAPEAGREEEGAERERNGGRRRGRRGRRSAQPAEEAPVAEAEPAPEPEPEPAIEAPAEAPVAEAQAAPTEEPQVAPTVEPAAAPSARVRGYGRGTRARGGAAGPPPLLPGQTVGSGAAPKDAGAAPAAELATAAAAPTPAAPDGLPTERDEVIGYLVSRFKGVGERTALVVVNKFGAENVFRVMTDEPDKLRSLVGPNRAKMLLAGLAADAEARAAGR